MNLVRTAAIVAVVLLSGLALPLGGGTPATASAQAADPAPCHWVGTATRPAERLSSSQHLIALRVERDLSGAGARRRSS